MADPSGSNMGDSGLSPLQDEGDSLDLATRQNQAYHLADQIVIEARSKAKESARQGLAQAGADAFKAAIRDLKAHDDGESDAWRLAQVELLIDLGDMPRARSLLDITDGPKFRPRLTSVASNQSFSPQDRSDREYTHMLTQRRHAQQWLELSVRVDRWDQTPQAETKLNGIDPSYFDIKTHLARFEKIKQLLCLGLLSERKAAIDGPEYRTKHLLTALTTYNHGCRVTNLGQSVYDFDHGDCQSLFLSAARICIHFAIDPPIGDDERPIEPQDITFELPLQGSTWRVQAWQYLEIGRARALIESIMRGDTQLPKRFAWLPFVAAVHTIRGSIRRMRRDTLTASQRPRTVPAVPDARQGFRRVRSNESPVTNIPTIYKTPTSPSMSSSSSTVSKRHQILHTLKIDDSITALSKEKVIASPLDYIEPRSGLIPEQRRRALTRWSQAYLFAKAASNVVTKGAVAAILPDSTSLQDLERIRSSIPEDTLVVEYGLPSFAATGLTTVVVDRSGVRDALWQNLNVPELKADVQDLRTAMYSLNARARDVAVHWPTNLPSNDSIEDLRTSLHAVLIAPISQYLDCADKVLFIPSGELVHVPWSMLVDKPTSTCPSLSIWQALHERSSRDEIATPKVSVMSNAPIDEQSREPRDIPFARIEALFVAHQNFNARPNLTDKLEWEAFGNIAASATILHLCAHSSFNNQSPMRSTIQLFKDPVTLSQWHNLRLKANLVTFSSCLSGMAKAYDSGSTIGFAHTLLATGTKAFIGSLWPVDDDATLLLMMMFYEELQRPLPPVEALYAAQTRMRNLDEDGLWYLLARLHDMVQQLGDEAYDYVDNPPYWLRQLEQLDVKYLRQPRCWAAFILTGYGYKVLYPTNTEQ